MDVTRYLREFNFKIKMCSKTQFVCFAFLIIALNQHGVLSMTRQQVKNSGKLLKKTCMPKNDVTEDQVVDIDKGKFLEERNVMCYVACIYTVGGVVKNNKMNHDAMLKQADMMFPPDMKEQVKAAINNCRGVGIIDVGHKSAKLKWDWAGHIMYNGSREMGKNGGRRRRSRLKSVVETWTHSSITGQKSLWADTNGGNWDTPFPSSRTVYSQTIQRYLRCGVLHGEVYVRNRSREFYVPMKTFYDKASPEIFNKYCNR